MDRIFFIIAIIILVILLIRSYRKNSADSQENAQLVNMRDAFLKLSDKVASTSDSVDLYQYILEICLKLIPKAKFGSVLMINSEGLFAPKASVGFNLNEISKLRLRLDEVFLFIATKGKMDQTVIINRLEDIVKNENAIPSGNQGFAIRSEISSPLRINNELVGVLCIDGDHTDIFVEQDIHILDYMSNQISIVLKSQRLHNEILYLTKYDSISQMLNRDSFEREAEKLLSDPSKDAPNLYFVLMDLDELKAANDTYGHQFGDEILAGFSEILRKHLGRNDISGRFGGDEFAAIIQGDYLAINHLLEEVGTELMEFKGKFSNDFIPGFSYGKASFIEGDCSVESLYKLADSRMEQMKKAKKRERS